MCATRHTQVSLVSNFPRPLPSDRLLYENRPVQLLVHQGYRPRRLALVDGNRSPPCKRFSFLIPPRHCDYGLQVHYTPIPLYLEVRTDGANSFDPESIDVCLVRTLPTHGLAGDGRRLDVARAEWWLASEQGSSLHRTQFWGEILVNKALTPSFDFSMCSVRYSIVLYSRSSPQNSEREPLLSEDVILALRNPVGVVPLPQAPPRTSTRPLERRPSAVARSFVAQGRHRAGRIT